MKKNLLLVLLLGALLLLTWLITEKKLLEEVPAAETRLQEKLLRVRSLKLPQATLVQEDGVWRLADGEVARADYLQELHRSLEQIKIARTLDEQSGTENYFSAPVSIVLDDLELVIGDLSATGESFYFKLKNETAVHLVDLQEMGSMAVADSDHLLQQEKYNRLRDLVQLPSPRWRETRLAALTRFGAFKSWQAGEFLIEAKGLKGKSWGEPMIQALQAGISSLEVQGAPVTQKPSKHAKVDDWIFTLDDASKASWEFFEHPSLELLYVWIPRLSKGYPLGQASSDFVKGFLPKLIDRPFSLTLWPDPLTEVKLQEGGDFWVMKQPSSQERAYHPAGLDQTRANALIDFLSSKQTFDHLALLSGKDCGRLADGARFHLTTGNQTWAILPVTGALVFLECSTRVALTWGKPQDSNLDFTTLRVAQ